MRVKVLYQQQQTSYGRHKLVTLVFFREDMFYPIDIPPMPDDQPNKTIEEIALDNAELNPGTIRVEDIHGNVLWRLQ